ncbi:response regulator transcription factor [Streptomyces sp. G-5]|uniref:response regulator transcription factor n=1 Tax=Streptomyces sp. G-5 TaxID=2977231 RepID=UPI0021D0C2F1|nr:LuxR C-terminal-related transcriptional regulator [Streptomyces sp. G-5]MCU4750240.1 LuxR C-terminal-related transcriptional regulator [Streptomyces sp. G-5]
MTTTTAPVRAAIQSPDPLARIGLTTLLAGRPDIQLTEPESAADVLVFAVETIDRDAAATLRRARAATRTPLAVVPSDLTGDGLAWAVSAGARGILPRTAVSPDRLSTMITAVAQGDTYLGDRALDVLLTHLIAKPGTLLTDRHRCILRLLAEGASTYDIAQQLQLTERAVTKDVTHLMDLLRCRNRTALVARVLRDELI